MFNWNDLESFLVLSRNKKLTHAAKKLNVESTTISRRILRLEQNLQTKLFVRNNKGYVLTDSGHKLLLIAERIESETISIGENFSSHSLNISGTVRIAMPEGLGLDFFSKYLNEFYTLHPEIFIELVADTRSRNLLTKEIDISINLSRPKRGKLVSWKLTDYYLRLYASSRYIKSSKPINSLKDLNNHKFISYIDDLIDYPELRYLKDLEKNIKIVFKSNSLKAQLNAVSESIGISLLHCFIAKKNKDLKILLKNDIKIKREYWIVVHEDLIKLKRVRAVIDFLTKKIKLNKKEFLDD